MRTNEYARQKADVARLLDAFERGHPHVRTVRLRPGLIFKRESAAEQRRYFGGPFVPGSLLRRGLVPLWPVIPGLRFQAVHAHDVGEAYRLAVARDPDHAELARPGPRRAADGHRARDERRSSAAPAGRCGSGSCSPASAAGRRTRDFGSQAREEREHKRPRRNAWRTRRR